MVMCCPMKSKRTFNPEGMSYMWGKTHGNRPLAGDSTPVGMIMKTQETPTWIVLTPTIFQVSGKSIPDCLFPKEVGLTKYTQKGTIIYFNQKSEFLTIYSTSMYKIKLEYKLALIEFSPFPWTGPSIIIIKTKCRTQTSSSQACIPNICHLKICHSEDLEDNHQLFFNIFSLIKRYIFNQNSTNKFDRLFKHIFSL